MSLADVGNRELTWSGPDPSGRLYLLQAGDEEFGSLQIEDESGAIAIGRLRGQEWVFERSGTLHPRVSIHPVGSHEPAAVVSLRWTGGGVVSFASGAQYCWRPGNLLSPKWCLSRQGEERSICFIQQGPLPTRAARVIPSAGCADLPEFPVLVLVGWYLRVMLINRLIDAAVSCEQ